MTEPLIRCPGTYDQGCGGWLEIGAEWCGECGRSFSPREVFEMFVQQHGWMEAEVSTTE